MKKIFLMEWLSEALNRIQQKPDAQCSLQQSIIHGTVFNFGPDSFRYPEPGIHRPVNKALIKSGDAAVTVIRIKKGRYCKSPKAFIYKGFSVLKGGYDR